MNINSDDFLLEFDIKDAVVGQVGYGYIGKAVEELFKPFCKKVVIYDKFVPALNDLNAVVSEADVIFVAVPTPMDKKTGECHTGIIESVLQDIQNAAVDLGRDVKSFIVVMKSTVPPGFTRKMQERLSLRLLFSPEFLTEANSVQDFKNASRVILGGEMNDARIVYRFFAGVWPERLYDVYEKENDLTGLGPVIIAQSTPEIAELVKLFTNGILMTKVLFCNEMYQLCEKIGVKYDEVRLLALFDNRIGQSHTQVPGPDGYLGAGGHCFYKDMQSLKFIADKLGTGEELFTSILSRNDVLRGPNGRDWEKMEGRAVIE